jgi:hypothetical protein
VPGSDPLAHGEVTPMPEHPGGQQRVRPVLQAVAEAVRDDDHVGASRTYGRFAVGLRPILDPPRLAGVRPYNVGENQKASTNQNEHY